MVKIFFRFWYLYLCCWSLWFSSNKFYWNEFHLHHQAIKIHSDERFVLFLFNLLKVKAIIFFYLMMARRRQQWIIGYLNWSLSGAFTKARCIYQKSVKVFDLECLICLRSTQIKDDYNRLLRRLNRSVWKGSYLLFRLLFSRIKHKQRLMDFCGIFVI